MTATKRRWSFRARLTALIAAVFVTGGVVLLGVQYVLVHQLFHTAIGDITGCIEGEGVTVTAGDVRAGSASCEDPIDLGPAGGIGSSAGSTAVVTRDDGYAVFVQQSNALSQEVLSGLLFWSVATLLIFTGVAIVVASWLSRRPFARIGQITDTTKRITRDDLHQRLGLPGPADEIKELGDTIDTMLDRLEASFSQQARFITNASHELRTPLTTTRAALEIPLTQGKVPKDLEPAIQRALDANQRSEQLIAALLQLARTTTTRPAGGQARTELVPIVEQSLIRHQDDINAAHLTVTNKLDDAAVRSADPTLLALAIDNLIDNAIRHNTDHGALHVATGTTGEHTWIEVTNSGPEFSSEEAARLVEPFNRGQRTRTAAGGRSLGLGLTLVQNIAESAGATLALSPGPAGGLIARIAF